MKPQLADYGNPYRQFIANAQSPIPTSGQRMEPFCPANAIERSKHSETF
jgi:hypothetical protein